MNGQILQLSAIFITLIWFVLTIFNKRVYLTFKSNLTLKDGIIGICERTSVSLTMLSAKQGNYWNHSFY